jgi:membrane protease YdiL (CAAX protease family)
MPEISAMKAKGLFAVRYSAVGDVAGLAGGTMDTVQGAPERTARGWVVLVAPLLAIVLFLGFLALGFVVFLTTIKPPPTSLQIQQLTRQVLTSYQGQMGATIAIYLAVLLAIWLLLPKSGPASLQSYFSRVSIGTFVLALMSGVIFAFLVGFALTELSTHNIVTFHATKAEEALVPRSLVQLGPALLAIAVVGPFVEEVYFRGIMLRWLRSWMPLVIAAIPDAAIFAAIHFRFTTHVGIEGWVLTGGLFLFGLFAVGWAAGTRSLWPSFAAHGMYNAALIAGPLLANQK